MKPLYITATRPTEGKTFFTLGLTYCLYKRFPNIGFMKPLGLANYKIAKYKYDEDIVLISRICKLHENLSDMGPIVIGPGFDKNLLSAEKQKEALTKIKDAYQRIAATKDLVIVEGTSHASTGFVYGLSNARIARLLDAKVIIISSGGIGHPVDEIELNKTYFFTRQVSVLGCVINKVLEDEVQDVKTYTKLILEKNGIKFLGVLPKISWLLQLTFKEVMEELGGELISGVPNINNKVTSVKIGAMTPANALELLSKDSIIVIPGDRIDLILADCIASDINPETRIAGFVFTGNLRPHKIVIDYLTKKEIPAIIVPFDTYTATSKINKAMAKMLPVEKEQLDVIAETIEKNVDVEYILERIK